MSARRNFVWGCFLLGACSAARGGSTLTRNTTSGNASAATNGSQNDTAVGGGLRVDLDAGGDQAPPPDCGDGELTPDEACDDGNTVSGDGCSANCLSVEPGYSCVPPGKACQKIAICGDGVVAHSEECDDGNTTAGDGCSPTCKYEVGYKCSGMPSVCTLTTCGDGIKEGAESCDDGNKTPFDGCSATCQAEPNCASTTGACSSTCGDGIVLGNEECDDGNLIDGDGCSSTCGVEIGFACSQTAACQQVNGKCVLQVPVVYHDFNAGMPSDFEVSCSTAVPGIVQTTLNAQGLPALDTSAGNSAPYIKACIASPATFNEWYTDSADSNRIVSSITLFDNGNGGFVNRWGPNGEQWQGFAAVANGTTPTESWAANDYTTCAATGCLPCSYDKVSAPPLAGCTGAALASFDGNPLFFPLDNNPAARLGTLRGPAQVPPAYGYNWVFDTDLVTVQPPAVPHDFSFTSHIVYWFKYDASKSATLGFTGDDDVFVFINRTLAVDLGGLHTPLDGSVTVNSTTAGKFGLADGQVYEISVFQAERKRFGSSFRLTLAGFYTAPSVCSAICGDGIVEAGEQCDDGVNQGGYGQCGPGCMLSAYCGDRIVQPPEQCDDGHPTGDGACGSGCRNVVIR